MAETTFGFQCIMLYKPTQKIDISHNITIGANIKATLCVPICCRANRLINMTQASKRSAPSIKRKHNY